MSDSFAQIGKNNETSTPISTGKAPVSPAIVRYDSHCWLCTQLAHFMGKLSSPDILTFVPFVEEHPRHLAVEISQDLNDLLPPEVPVKILYDADAWRWLLEHHPALSAVHWIAEKLGWTEVTANMMARSTDVLRRMCHGCRPRGVFGSRRL